MLKFLKYAAIGGAAVSTGISLHANDYDINSLGVVRLGRSAYTAADVALTYKRQLYYKNWDKSSKEYKEQRSVVHKIAAKKILELMRTNRGVYIKVGQHIGGLEYLLPTEFVETMKELHSTAPANPVEDLFKVIRQDFNTDQENLFETFELEPLGVASLAQVHKATLKTGETVAVKVQHPYVKSNSRVDMKTIELLVKIMSIVFPDLKIQWLVDESKRNLPIELDFLNEGKNAEKIQKQFQHYEWLKIPKIYWNLSTSRVLVMEYLEGEHVTNLSYINKNKIDPVDVSNKISLLYSEMIFRNGFVHADPHPGNILVNKNKKNGTANIILLDHGLYAELTDEFRYDYSNLWLSILRVDKVGMKKHAINLGVQEDLFGLFACMVAGRPYQSIMSGIANVKVTKNEKEVLQNNTAKVLSRIGDVLEQVDRQMLLILKTNDLIRGIEATIGTQNRMTAFWTMSNSCIRSSFDQIKHKPEFRRFHKRFFVILKENLAIFKLNLYYLYLGVINFSLLSTINQLLM